MDTGGRLVAGSRNRNEFVVINADDIGKPKPLQQTSGQICQICEDGIELVGDEQEKEPFVACNECAFPVCRTCYEYERKEGTQACPHCKTRYKRHKGSARVHGDEEEDGNDDVEDEFSFFNHENVHKFSEATSVMGGAAQHEHRHPGFNTNVPLLTYGEEVDGISSDDHALVPSFMNGGGTHPVPYQGTTQPRVINPKKDISLYGYGSVAWKDRMEDWRRKQINQPQNSHPEAGYKRGLDGDGIDNPDLPM